MMRPAILVCLCLLVACKRAPAPRAPEPDDVRAATASAEQSVRDQALADLQNDLVTLRMELGVVSSMANAAMAAASHPRSARGALYTCDRVAVAQHALADVPGAQAALGEAESLCAYRAPLAAAGERLDAATAVSAVDCASMRDVLERVGPKYRDDETALALFASYKTACPKTRLFAHAHASSSVTSSRAATARPDSGACRERCSSAAFSCRASCTTCGSCTNDKTWEWCHQQCDSCKQSCEQSETFCKAGCGE